MKHFGDITKISGFDVPIVDVITGGSPCQDLSVAGKRAGLEGERSGLFMEQIRIVKEMREHDRQLRSGRTDEHIRPRFLVWENVPGAFSSNKGKDFQAVLTEIVRIAEPEAADVPMPEKGRWSKSGCLYDELGKWSVAWTVHNAAEWGVPQRRVRISLVADFGGLAAPEILFERKGLRGDFTESREEGQGTTTVIERSLDKAISFQERAGKPGGGKGILIQDERTGALSTLNNQSVFAIEGHVIDRETSQNGVGVKKDISHTLNATDRHAVYATNQQMAQGVDMYNQTITGEKAMSITGAATDPHHVPCVVTERSLYSIGHDVQFAKFTDDEITDPLMANDYKDPIKVVSIGNGQLNQMSMAEQANTLDTMHDQQAVLCFQNTGQGWWNESDVGATIRTPCGGDSSKANLVAAVDCRNGVENEKVNGTLQAKSTGGIGLNFNNVCRQRNMVRRLTPLECERLQGFPDGWTSIGEWTDSKGKLHKEADSPRYKALGNSIALPFWQYLARRICAQYERDITMASLFDGIGGFPYVFEHCGAKAVWASEIEEFPIAVTKYHFPEENKDCRNCKKWLSCPCGEKGHRNGTSYGYSVGECKDYEPIEEDEQ